MKKYKKGSIVKETPRVNESLETIKQYPVWAIDGTRETHNRGVTQETAEYFGIRTGWSEVDQRITGYYFPVTKKGEVVGYVKVDLDKPKKAGRWSVVGDVSIDCDLLGQEQAQKNKGSKLFIVEGVWDLAIAYQCLKEGAQKKYNREVFPNVTTFPLGLGDPSKGKTNARQSLVNNLEFIQSYGKPKLTDKGFMAAGVVTCFDNDNPRNDDSIYNVGQEAVKDCSLVLKDFYNVLLPINDCSDMYKEKGTGELYNQLVFNAKSFENDHIVSSGIGLETLKEPLKKGVHVDIIPRTMNMLKGLREREMTVILAPTGVGKTTVCKELGYAMVKAGRKVGHVFLEEDLKKTQQTYIALDNNVHLPRLRSDPDIISEDKWLDSYNKLIDNGNTMWMSHFGSLEPRSLLNKFEWMAIKGMEFIILDHISMVFSGQNSKNERQEIDQLLTELAAFTTKTGVHPIIVSHIKRVNKVLPKDKEGNVKYPYWDTVDETQARGSGAFEQLAWNIIALEPEKLEDGTRGKIRTRLLKNREWGTLGIGDVLTMNPATGRLVLSQEEEY